MDNEVSVIESGEGLKNGYYQCPNCGATEIHFNEKVGKLFCEYCHSEFDGKKLQGYETDLRKLSGKKVGTGAKKINTNAEDIITIRCKGCGAEVVIDTKNSTEARCHWCRGILSINERIENGAVPDMILPFQLPKEEAKNLINDFVKKRKFYANKTFKKEFTLDNIIGVYFPYILVDANAHCEFEGTGEHQTRSYEIDDTKYYDADAYKVSRSFDIIIDDLSIESNSEASDKTNKRKTNNIINSIMPFDTENCVVFTSNYLTGYNSEKRDVNIEDVEKKVNLQLLDVIKFSLNDKLKQYNRGLHWDKQDIDIKGTQWVTAYLPVWLYSYHQKDKDIIHYVAVNARTKETMGSVPINKTRLFIVSAIVEFFSSVTGLMILSHMDSDDDGGTIVILLFLAGFVYYAIMYARYRNQDARHSYENETKNEMDNLVGDDIFIEKRKKLRSPVIKDCNSFTLAGDDIKTKNIVEKLAGQVKTNK